MPPRRGKGKARATSTRKAKEASPDIYDDMLAEAAITEPIENGKRPFKRRRVMREVSIPERRKDDEVQVVSSAAKAATPGYTTASPDRRLERQSQTQQTIEASSESDDSDEFVFEDVDLKQQPSTTNTDDEGIADISIAVDTSVSAKKAAANRRKPATAAEKSLRLLVHKAHLLTLLAHCAYANSRCNNAAAQDHLRNLLDKRMLSYLNPKRNDTQFQRNRSFMDGLDQASKAFKAEYRITASGMRRAHWLVDDEKPDPDQAAEPVDLADFVAAARDLEGSQDTGNQLFCALLRSAGVEARLVCSPQTLPYASAPAKTSTPQKYKKPAVFAVASDTDPNASDASVSDSNIGSSSTIGKVPSVRRRLGQPSFAPESKARPPPKERKKPIRKLSYPVFWVEAFNTAHQKWIPVDPLATDTINKASKLEPPASSDLNQLMYVVAFEDDGVARDVTRRYAKAFNAKTRRQRVEGSGEEGTKWLKKALRLFRRRDQHLDRDQVEDAELANKEAREGLPTNVLDFKGHPYYALERHLKRNEVLHPRREVGKVNAGTAAKPRMEAVFRRQDVYSCKSADKWYRLGRDIKPHQAPLKHVPARASRRAEDDEDQGGNLTALYAPYQTEVYVPPPVINGKIPKNGFGNLDLYVPSMVPPGAAHIRHALAQQAAHTLQIDYADAVTGFKFQGRHGTAIVEGAVVAQEYADAVQAIIDGLEHAAMEEASKARSLTALRMWARFLKGLEISARVAAYGDKATTEAVKEQVDHEEAQETEAADAGGFLPGDTEEAVLPTAGQYSVAELITPKSSKKAKKMVVESESSEEEYHTSPRRTRGRRIIADDEDEYVPEGHQDGGGGFLPEDAETVNDQGEGFLTEDAVPHDGRGGFMAEDGGISISSEQRGGFVPDGAMHENYGGGGFLPDANEESGGGGGHLLQDVEEADDGSGGGFLPEENQDEYMPRVSAPDQESGGFVPEVSEMDVLHGCLVREAEHGLPMHGQRKEVPTEEKAGLAEVHAVSQALSTGEARSGYEAASDVKEPLPRVNTANNGADGQKDDLASAEHSAPTEESDGDRGSLLSHDPEDDDAEPDWMESD